MRPYLIILLAVLLMTAACGGNRTAPLADDGQADSVMPADTAAADSLADALEEMPMPKAADELIDDFIFNFAANSRLQRQRIAFPLPQYGEDGEAVRLRRSDWHMDYFFMPQGFYTMLFDSEQHMEAAKDTAVSHVEVERIAFDDGRVTKYVFDRIKGLWMMTAVHRMPMAQSLNASFLDFYHRFASDSTFQAHSLAETVAFVGPDPDDDFSEMEGVISPDSWEAFAPELPSDVIYNIVYGKPEEEGDSKVFVLRGIANGFEVQMTFRRKGGKWKLTKLIT